MITLSELKSLPRIENTSEKQKPFPELAISELRRELGRVSNFEISYLTKFGAPKLNKDQVMTLET